jgi:hypothetical protein
VHQTQPHPPGTPGPVEEAASVRSIVVQVAAYAGVAMGLVGTLTLVATTAEPSDTTLLLVAIAVTAVLFAAGIAISRHSVSSDQRLRSVLWFAALFGWGVVVEGFLVVAEIDLAGRSRQLLSAALVAVVAVGLWVGLRRTLQLIGMFSSLFAVLSAAVFPQPDPFGQPDLLASALLSWLFGAAWMALGARGVIQPARPALVLGTITVLVSPVFLLVQGFSSETTLTVVELWVLAGSVGCLVAGSWLADRAVQGLAIVGVLAGVAVLAGDQLAGSREGSIAAVVLGMALLAGAVIAIRGSRPPAAPAPTAPSETLPEPPFE